MDKTNASEKVEFKLIPCECCQYPVAVPVEASDAVCITCPQCGNRSCS